jgi:hypothetical protein
VNGSWLKRTGGIFSALLTAFIPMSLSDCNGDGATGPASGQAAPGRIKEQELRDKSGSLIDLWVYDYSGAEGSVKTVGHDSSGRITDSSIDLANAFGNIIRSHWYYVAGGSSSSSHTDYTYDGNQTLIADTTYSDANVKMGFNTYEFVNGRKTRNDYYSIAGRVSYMTYEYDARGTRTKSVGHDTTGQVTSFTTYGYFAGVLDTVKIFDANDSVTQVRAFKMEKEPSPYDYMEYGNW